MNCGTKVLNTCAWPIPRHSSVPPAWSGAAGGPSTPQGVHTLCPRAGSLLSLCVYFLNKRPKWYCSIHALCLLASLTQRVVLGTCVGVWTWRTHMLHCSFCDPPGWIDHFAVLLLGEVGCHCPHSMCLHLSPCGRSGCALPTALHPAKWWPLSIPSRLSPAAPLSSFKGRPLVQSRGLPPASPPLEVADHAHLSHTRSFSF